MEIEDLKSYNILYVEDSATIRSQMTEILSELFDTLFVAADGAEGLKLFMEHEQKLTLL